MTKSHEPKAVRTSKKPKVNRSDPHPPPEDEYGGGDFTSPEVAPPTDDDKPLE